MEQEPDLGLAQMNSTSAWAVMELDHRLIPLLPLICIASMLYRKYSQQVTCSSVQICEVASEQDGICIL